jgi:hypothetical protein
LTKLLHERHISNFILTYPPHPARIRRKDGGSFLQKKSSIPVFTKQRRFADRRRLISPKIRTDTRRHCPHRAARAKFGAIRVANRGFSGSKPAGFSLKVSGFNLKPAGFSLKVSGFSLKTGRFQFKSTWFQFKTGRFQFKSKCCRVKAKAGCALFSLHVILQAYLSPGQR